LIRAAPAATSLSNWDIYLLSAAGALVVAVLIFVLPPLAAAQRAGNLNNWTGTKVALTLALLLLYTLIGGLGAFILGDKPSTIRGALLAGIRAPALIKALSAAGREATAPR
jgi:hypothetical protein